LTVTAPAASVTSSVSVSKWKQPWQAAPSPVAGSNGWNGSALGGAAPTWGGGGVVVVRRRRMRMMMMIMKVMIMIMIMIMIIVMMTMMMVITTVSNPTCAGKECEGAGAGVGGDDVGRPHAAVETADRHR
jgi:hypothetical protein